MIALFPSPVRFVHSCVSLERTRERKVIAESSTRRREEEEDDDEDASELSTTLLIMRHMAMLLFNDVRWRTK